MPKNIKLVYTNKDATAIENAFAHRFQYQETVNDLPNPKTKWEFFADQLEQWIGDIVLANETRLLELAVTKPVKIKTSSREL